jgi:hypothetical protein
MAQEKPIRVGTTAVDFLSIGFGSAGSSMGDAYVALANDLSSAYWNPAGLAHMEQNEAMFIHQPWLVDINTNFIGVGAVIPRIGTLALSVIAVDYGEMDVTTMDFQEGTGEKFDANDIAFGLSYARTLTNWFAVGLSGKFISSSIWHTTASAIAADLGVQIKTTFFSPKNDRANGLTIGMSISNYGTRMRYDGLDLLNPIDISEYEDGNFADTPGQFRLQQWELPLIFRVGIVVHPLIMENHKISFAVDALHPNNNSESVNIGTQYSFTSPGLGKVSFRGGYKALFMEDSQYGPTFGFGLETFLLNNAGIKLEYTYRDIGLLGSTNCYGISVLF